MPAKPAAQCRQRLVSRVGQCANPALPNERLCALHLRMRREGRRPAPKRARLDPLLDTPRRIPQISKHSRGVTAAELAARDLERRLRDPAIIKEAKARGMTPREYLRRLSNHIWKPLGPPSPGSDPGPDYGDAPSTPQTGA